MPATESDLMQFLTSLGITVTMHRHAPVFTVEDARAHRGEIPGGHCKCLFVRDKKKRRLLAVVGEERRVDLNGLAAAAGMGRLSFSSADSLMDMLGVVPGSVTPFALINARVAEGEEPPLMVVLDKAMMAHELLNYHPLHNAATVTIRREDLVAFIQACGFEPMIVNLDGDITH